MKKHIVFITLLMLVAVAQSLACTCHTVTSFRQGIYQNLDTASNLPGANFYLLTCVRVATINELDARLLVLAWHSGAVVAEDTIVFRHYGVCGGAAPLPGDTVIGSFYRQAVADINSPVAEGEFFNYYCAVNYLAIRQGMVEGWGNTPFPAADFQDSLNSFYANPIGGVLSAGTEPTYSRLELYPNPASYEVHLNTAGAAFEEVRLFDVLGKLVLSQFIVTAKTLLPVSNLSPGLYMAVARDKAGRIYRGKVVKR